MDLAQDSRQPEKYLDIIKRATCTMKSQLIEKILEKCKFISWAYATRISFTKQKTLVGMAIVQ